MIVVASLAGLVVLALAYVFIASEVILDRTYPRRPSAVHAPAAAEAIARGAHLVVVATCTDCHGKDLAGTNLDVPGSTLYAPNLTALTATLSDADFDRAIRQGLRPNGRSLLVMPSHAYANFTDDEVALIIAYLRSLRPRGAVSPNPRLGLLVRAFLAVGLFKTEADELAAARPPLELGPRYDPGRHLASVICATCHGTELSGTPKDPVLPTPDLMLVAAYSRGDFHTLMRTGKASGNREVGIMSKTARNYFSSFTDPEIDAIYDYLVARGNAVAASHNAPGSP